MSRPKSLSRRYTSLVAQRIQSFSRPNLVRTYSAEVTGFYAAISRIIAVRPYRRSIIILQTPLVSQLFFSLFEKFYFHILRSFRQIFVRFAGGFFIPQPPKPPLCKGRCRGTRRRDCYRAGGFLPSRFGKRTISQSFACANASPLYTRGPFALYLSRLTPPDRSR